MSSTGQMFRFRGWSLVREKQEIDGGPWRYQYLLFHTRGATARGWHLWFGRWSDA